MIYRTGRNATLSVKTTQDTIALFYAVAEQKGWKAGETFEKAIALLAKQEKIRKSGTISENERTS
jgi:lipid-binding SYLF domain-containing protein